AMPALGSGEAGEIGGMYMVNQHTQTLAFVEAMHGLFIVTAIITALGIPLALMMRSGPSKSADGPAIPHVGWGGVPRDTAYARRRRTTAGRIRAIGLNRPHRGSV